MGHRTPPRGAGIGPAAPHAGVAGVDPVVFREGRFFGIDTVFGWRGHKWNGVFFASRSVGKGADVVVGHRLNAASMGNERGGHDQRSGQDHHQEHPLVETVKHQPGVLRFNGKEEEDGDQPARGNVQKGRQRLLLHDGQQHEPNDVQKDTDDQSLHQHFEVEQHPQADGHSKQHKEESPNHKGALQR